MRIEPNVELHNKLTKALDEFKKARQRGGIHASDLGQPRKAYMQAVHPLPLTDKEAAFFLVGRGHHYYVVYAATGHPDTDEGSQYSEELGIWYSPDLNIWDAEFKTNRMAFPIETQEDAEKFFDEYEMQCQTYAAAKGLNHFNLIVLYICPTEHVEGKRCEECGRSSVQKKQEPIYGAYTYHWTDEEMEEHKEWVRATKAAIEIAIHMKSPNKLPLCKEAFCIKKKGQGRGKPMIPLAACKWFEVCKPEGRYELVMNPPTSFKRKKD